MSSVPSVPLPFNPEALALRESPNDALLRNAGMSAADIALDNAATERFQVQEQFMRYQKQEDEDFLRTVAREDFRQFGNLRSLDPSADRIPLAKQAYENQFPSRAGRFDARNYGDEFKQWRDAYQQATNIARDDEADAHAAARAVSRMNPANFDKVLMAVADLSDERAANRNKGYLGKLGEGVTRSAAGVMANFGRIADLDNMSGEDRLRFRQLLAARDSGDPLVPFDAKWYNPVYWPIRASEMSVPMAAGVATGGAIGAAAGAAGGPAWATATAEMIGNSGFWMTQIYPDRYDEYRSRGMSETVAGRAAFASALLESAVESINVNPLSGTLKIPKVGLRAAALDFAKSAGAELSEEGIQGFIQEGIGRFGEELSKANGGKTGDVWFYENLASQALAEGLGQMADAAGPLLVLMGTSHIATEQVGKLAGERFAQRAQELKASHGEANDQAVGAAIESGGGPAVAGGISGEGTPDSGGAAPATEPPRRFTKAELRTSEGLAEFIRNQPEAAAELVSIAQNENIPSRERIADVVDPNERWNKAERAAFANKLAEFVSSGAENGQEQQTVQANAEGRQGQEGLLTQQQAALVSGVIPNASAAPPRPGIHVSVPLWSLSLSELRKALDTSEYEDAHELETLFGKDGAEKYRKLERRANSRTASFESSRAAGIEMNRMEESLSQSDQNRLFGIGEPEMHQTETLREFVKAKGFFEDATRKEIVRELSNAVISMSKDQDPSKWSHSEQIAAAKMAAGFERAKMSGYDTETLFKEIVGAAVLRLGGDEQDAELMLGPIVDRFVSKDRARGRDGRAVGIIGLSQRELPQPSAPDQAVAQQAGADDEFSIPPAQQQAVQINEDAFVFPDVKSKGENLDRARSDLKDSLRAFKVEFVKTTIGGSLGALGGNLSELSVAAARVVRDAVRVGVHSFAEFMQNMARVLGSRPAIAMQDEFMAHWNELRAEDDRLDEPFDQSDALVGMQEFQPNPRPDLAVPGQTLEAGQILGAADAIRQQAGEPTRITRADTAAEASRRVDIGEISPQTILDIAKAGGQLDAAQTIAAQQMRDASAPDAIRSGDRAKLAEAINLAAAYRRTGTTQAQAFGMRRGYERAVAEATRANGGNPPSPQQINSAHAKLELQDAVLIGPRNAEKLSAPQRAAEIEKIKGKLKLLDIDLDAELSNPNLEPTRAAFIVGQVGALRSSWRDVAYEWWRNSILSGPLTQVANVLGNAGMGAYHFLGRRLVASAIGSATGAKDAPKLAEYQQIVSSMLPAFGQAFRNFALTFKHESSQFQRDVKFDTGSKVEEGPAISGTAGKVVRTPSRTLAAADDFFQTLYSHLEVSALADREGRKLGLSGDALNGYIAEQLLTPTSDSWRKAVDISNELTFKNKSDVANAAIGFRRAVPGSEYLVPFINTPYNILKTGLRVSPFGALKLPFDLHRAVTTGNWEGIPERVSEQLLAWGALAYIIGSNSPDKPWLTGTGDSRPYPSQSIYIPGIGWKSYARVEPFATALALIADFSNAVHRKDPIEAAGTPPVSVLRQVTSKTFLSGLSDIIEVLHEAASAPEDRVEATVARAMTDMTTKFAISWIPNLIRQPIREYRESLPERGVWGGTPYEWANRALDRLAQKTELAGGVLPDHPKYDVWGREIPTSGWPQSLYFARLMDVTDVGVQKPFQGDLARLAWNNNPANDRPFNPHAPDKYIEDGKQKKYLTDDQYERLARDSGLIARTVVDRIGVNTTSPAERDIEFMRNASTAALRYVKGQMTPEVIQGAAPRAVDIQAAAEIVQRDLLATKLRKLAESLPKNKGMTDKWRKEVEDQEAEQLDTAIWLAERRISFSDLTRAYIKDQVDGQNPVSSETIARAAGKYAKINQPPK